MIKTLFKHSFIYMIPTVLSRGIGLFLLPIYTRFLSPTEYGVLDLFAIVMSLVNLTIALEISQALARYYQEFQDQEIRKAYVSTAFWFTIGMYLIYLAGSIYFADICTIYLLDTLRYKHIFYLATLSITTNGIFLFTQNQLRWQLEPKKYTYTSLLYTLSTTIIALTLLWATPLKVESIFIAQITGSLLSLLLSIYFGKQNYAFIFVGYRLKQMIHFSAPLVLSSLAVFTTLYIDRIIIKEVLGLYFLGLYGIAYKFASVASLVISGFQSSLTPLIYKHYKEPETPNNISKIFSLYVAFSLFILSGSILFSKEAIILMTTPQYYSAAALIPFLILTVVLNQMYHFAPGLGIGNKTLTAGFIYLGGALGGILLNFGMVLYFGLLGSAIATVLNGFLVFIIYFHIAQKYYPIAYQWNNITKWFFLLIGGSIIIYFLIQEINLLNIFIKIIALLFMGGYLIKENIQHNW